ncbi:GIN domain-containing protein [Pedobacter terrae]|uniref:GIN domain-containing protein n=1 Tax=Pedobacter terrae TaxID=405671 RepID=UPI002FF63CBE
MKTSIKTLTKSVLAAIFFSSAIFSTSVIAGEKQPIKISTPKNIQQVVVSGNVEITLVQGDKESVSYNEDNAGKVKVIQDGHALKISSADGNLAKVTVYVKNIFRVQASENAVVKTAGKLNAKYLQLFLSGEAVAAIDSNTEGLYTVIEDLADLKLSGATQEHILVMGSTPKLNLDRFAALKTQMSAPVSATQTASLSK